LSRRSRLYVRPTTTRRCLSHYYYYARRFRTRKVFHVPAFFAEFVSFVGDFRLFSRRARASEYPAKSTRWRRNIKKIPSNPTANVNRVTVYTLRCVVVA